MRFSMGGVPPCDRRRDRRKVAIAAAAALFLFAASKAQAAPVEFVIDASKSFMFQATEFDLSALALGKKMTTSQSGPIGTWGGPNAGGSDTMIMSGLVYADLTATDITLLSSSALNFAPNPVGPGGYFPYDPVVTDPIGPPPVALQIGAQYGVSIPTLGFFAQIHDLRATFSPFMPTLPLLPGPTGVFAFAAPAATQGIYGTEGRLALISGVSDPSTDDLVGSGLAFMNSGLGAPAPLGPDVGTWDGTTLTIPFTSYVPTSTVLDVGGTPTTITISIFSSGVIVATPTPEPSTMVLLGFGVVGLMTCAWRVKKRKTLVG